MLAKHQPADVGQHEHDGDPQDFRAGKCLERRRNHPGGQAIDQDEDSIYKAPEDEVPGRAVPKAGKKKTIRILAAARAGPTWEPPSGM